MTSWVATANAIIDASSWNEVGDETVIVLLPTLPAEPIGLQGEFAELYKRLMSGPVDEAELTPEELETVREFELAGMASQNPDDPARVTELHTPWLTSPMHELVNGLIASLAQQNNLRVLTIKGPTLHKQGIRTKEHSGDVDLWVAPDHITKLVSALTDWGWTKAETRWENSAVYHSFTLRPTTWGCEIDVHRHLPGFALPDDDALRVLQADAAPITFAGVTAQVPNVPAHAVMNALHLLRPQQGRSVPAGNEALAIKGLQAAGEDALAFAQRSGADGTLHGTLQQAFPDLEIVPQNPVPLNWKWRAEPNRLKRYIILFRTTPLTAWPKMGFRAVWPKADEALMLDRMYGGHATNAVQARFRRLGRGIRQQFRSK